MEQIKDIGFVIKRRNVGEADRFVTIYTQRHGKIDVLAKGVRRLTSRKSPNIEPLNLISFSAIKTRKNFILTEVDLIDSTETVKFNISFVQDGFLICELIDKLCPLWQKSEDIFALMHMTLQRIKSVDSEKLMRDFQSSLLTLLGFWDQKMVFADNADMEQYIEFITERKITSSRYFQTKQF